MRNKYLRIIFFAYLLCLILAAVLPINSGSSSLNNTFIIHIRLDYLAHAILFIPWILLYVLTFRPANLFDKFTMIGAGLLMAFATEGVQYFLAYRSYNINDLLSNFLGVLLGALLLFADIPYVKGKKAESRK
ncbi:MAG: VanZ family protein [Bacteroidales bacterium]